MDRPKPTEAYAMETDDVTLWGNIVASSGSLMPSDPEIIKAMFHKKRMEHRNITGEKRVASRQWLLERGFIRDIKDHPITILECIQVREIKNLHNMEVKDAVKGYVELILICSSRIVMNRAFLKIGEQLRGSIDPKRSSANRMEYWTTNNHHIKFVMPDDIYEIPQTSVAYKVITYAY